MELGDWIYITPVIILILWALYGLYRLVVGIVKSFKVQPKDTAIVLLIFLVIFLAERSCTKHHNPTEAEIEKALMDDRDEQYPIP